jgi:hypothetical protein
MADVKTKLIDGVSFKVAPFTAIEALKLKAHLMKVVAPAFGHALGSLGGASTGGSPSAFSVNGAELSQALASLMEQLGEDEFLTLVKRVFGQTSAEVEVQGKKIWMMFGGNGFEATFNVVFDGRVLSLYPALLFVLEVNFPDFFTRLGDIGNRLQTLMSGKAGESVTNSSKHSVLSDD